MAKSKVKNKFGVFLKDLKPLTYVRVEKDGRTKIVRIASIPDMPTANRVLDDGLLKPTWFVEVFKHNGNVKLVKFNRIVAVLGK